jgi:peptidoglycan/LPS O-acetylase OafA/YrhL
MTRAPLLLVRLVAASALGVVAGVHLHLAPGYALLGDQVTHGDLFRAQSAVAGVAALALVARPTRPVWLLAAAVGVASLLAVVVTVYVAAPAIGPLPRIFEPVWYAEKVLAAAAAGTACLAALVGLVPVARQRRRDSPAAPAAPRPVQQR